MYTHIGIIRILIIRFFLVLYRSSVVEKVLLSEYSEGKRFSVIVVDSKPLLEGIVK